MEFGRSNSLMLEEGVRVTNGDCCGKLGCCTRNGKIPAFCLHFTFFTNHSVEKLPYHEDHLLAYHSYIKLSLSIWFYVMQHRISAYFWILISVRIDAL